LGEVTSSELEEINRTLTSIHHFEERDLYWGVLWNSKRSNSQIKTNEIVEVSYQSWSRLGT